MNKQGEVWDGNVPYLKTTSGSLDPNPFSGMWKRLPDEAPEIREDLVKVATEIHPEPLHEMFLPRRKTLDGTDTVKLKDATLFEKQVVAATGASLERVRELQSLPNPEAELEKITGDKEIDVLYRDCIKCFAEKGEEYTVGSKDRLANFRGVAEDVGIPMEKAWYVFFNKHLRALQAYIKNGCQVKSNEPIQGRIMDLIVYLTLFYKMTLEIERTRANDSPVRKVVPTPDKPIVAF